jgi:hypothetical protein
MRATSTGLPIGDFRCHCAEKRVQENYSLFLSVMDMTKIDHNDLQIERYEVTISSFCAHLSSF